MGLLDDDNVDTHGEMLDLLRRRHEIYFGILNKDINLVAGAPPGVTDCETYIRVPFEDPEVALTHRHEWQHLFFKTNLRARALFVDRYT